MHQGVVLGTVAISAFVVGMWVNEVRHTQDEARAEKPAEEDQSKPNRVKERSMSRRSDDESDHLASVTQNGRIDEEQITVLLSSLSQRERFEVLEQLAGEWGRKDPQSAFAWATGLKGRERQVALESLFGQWSETDPEAAASATMTLADSSLKFDLVHWMTESWARRDLAAATAWAQEQGEVGAGARALLGLMEAMADQTLEDSVVFAMTLERENLRMEALRISARRWSEDDPRESMDWALSLNGRAQIEVADEIFHQVAEYDPALAAEYYEGLRNSVAGDEEFPVHLAAGIASRWLEVDPAGASQWTMNLQTGVEERSHVVGELTEQWLRIDDEAAGNWVSGLEQGRPRDVASDRIAHHLIDQDPGTTILWADQIEDQGHRGDLMIHVLESWHDRDPSAARSAYQSMNLEEEHRRVIEEEIFRTVDSRPLDRVEGE